MAKTYIVSDRIETIGAAWRNLAPEGTFAGMTLEQFEEAVMPAIEKRQELLALEKQVEGKRTERALADKAAREVLEMVVNSVRGTPGYGSDSTLYRAFGYVRKSERRSGLTRKAARAKQENVNAA
jgi:hypothetical protein